MISVIVPIYNVEKYLDECLASIVNQTYKDIEIICVNDCTLDNSINIVKKYMRMDSRVKLINHERNRGLGGARNTGIRYAQGEYIAFVDSDDSLELTMYEKMERAMRENEVDAVICGVQRCIENYGIVKESSFQSAQNMRDGVFCITKNKERLVNIWPSAWNKLYRTSIIKKFDLKYQEKLLYEDHFFFYSYFKHVKYFYYVNEFLYKYRASRPGSITSTLTGREKEVYTVLDSLEGIFESSFEREYWKREYAKVCFRLIWERQLNMWGNLDIWLSYTKNAKRWLLDRFLPQELECSVDESMDKMDPFYRYIFSRGMKRFLFSVKLQLKRWDIVCKVFYSLRRVKNYRTTRSLIKEIHWLAWDTQKTISDLTLPVWKVHDTIIESEANENINI